MSGQRASAAGHRPGAGQGARARQKLQDLRGAMERLGVAAYFVPSTDPHQSEYVPDCWQRRRWLSGFTGSAGDLLVTRSAAALWTDGRYWLQAEAELRGSAIELQRQGKAGVPTLTEFLKRQLKAGESLGADPRVLTPRLAQSLESALSEAGARLTLLPDNLVDALWTDRPSPSPSPLEALPQKVAGEGIASKLARLRKEMAGQRVAAHVLTTLDAIAWLFNVRGRDVAYNPVGIAYALVHQDKAQLFVATDKITPALRRALGQHVEIAPYEAVADALRALARQSARVWADEGTTSRWIIDLLSGAELVTAASPVYRMKARKNAAEIAGSRAAHVRDGVAMVRWMYWLSRAVPQGGVTELSAEARLEEFRAEGELFRGLSFRTISGYEEHGAIIHYASEESTNVPLRTRGIYLIDSGAQYLDGTTDITRTLWMGGKPTRQQADRYTRVLRGHIALARVVFPAGVRGMRLDTLARLPLWEAGLDYNHGTGHGVGAYLNVHEGPQAISPTRCVGDALEPGNIQSNEPGYYEAGAYGIRIENLILVVKDAALSSSERDFLRFETLTVCPIETRLIHTPSLSSLERAWLNTYHAHVFRTLGGQLEAPERRWLKAATARI